jgi:hypothetical protein
LLLVAAALLIAAVSPVAAQSVGGGVSVFVPESMYWAGEGSVGVETALGSSLGLGDILSLPFGVVYNKVYALMREIDGQVGGSPWFFSDTLSGHLMLKARLPVGPVYFDLFGGLGGFWAITLEPLVKNIETNSAPADHIYTFEEPLVIDGGRFGWGWQAGAGIGVKIDQISVDVNATYRLYRADATLRGTYSDVFSSTVTTGNDFLQALKIRLAGFSIGIDGSFAF